MLMPHFVIPPTSSFTPYFVIPPYFVIYMFSLPPIQARVEGGREG